VLRVLECRLFGGLSDEEIAVALDVSSRTAHRDWIKARGWLQLELRDWSATRRKAAP
jgi:DNA-directed RNA polymerase specialized sigma24 family protein